LPGASNVAATRRGWSTQASAARLPIHGRGSSVDPVTVENQCRTRPARLELDVLGVVRQQKMAEAFENGEVFGTPCSVADVNDRNSALCTQAALTPTPVFRPAVTVFVVEDDAQNVQTPPTCFSSVIVIVTVCDPVSQFTAQ
jgi:hypothetical protein